MGMYYEYRPLDWQRLAGQPVDKEEHRKESLLGVPKTTETDREKEAR